MTIRTGRYPFDQPGPGGLAERYSVDMDIGGTFTDAIFSSRRSMTLIKVDTTRHDLSVCFRKALERARETLGFESVRQCLSSVRVIRLSTSLSTNLILERKGLCIGLILAAGWKEAFLGKGIFPDGSGVLVEPEMVIEVGAESEESEVREAAYRLILRGADILVISLDGGKEGFLQAEERARAVIHRYYANHFIGSIPVVSGGQLSRIREYLPRTSRIVFNTYAHHAVSGPFLAIEDYLRENGYPHPLLLVHADGGTSRVSKSTAERTISSGAAAGVFGALRFSRIYGVKNALTVDIGGTSTELGVIRGGEMVWCGRGSEADSSRGLPIAVTIGIGGGSVVRLDDTGRVHLGPGSVGAFPGPACYGLGGAEPTLTDAFLILGYFDEGYFLGGERRLKRTLAEKVFQERVAGIWGVSCEEAALRVKEEAVGRIAEEIRTVIARFGLDPVNTALFAVGGCGGCMGCALCEAAGLRELRIFRQGSVFGAFGTSGMDVLHRYEEEVNLGLEPSAERGLEVCDRINGVVLALQRRAFQDMAAEGFQPEGIQFESALEITVEAIGTRWSCDCPTAFLWPGDWNAVRKRIGRLFGGDGAEVDGRGLRLVGIALTAVARVPHAEPDALVPFDEAGSTGLERRIYGQGGHWVDARVHRWDALKVPLKVSGPCILESRETTVVVSPGYEMGLDKRRNARISRSDAVACFEGGLDEDFHH